MKRVVSVSIGSSKRDNQAIIDVCGEKISMERIGTDGDIGRAIDLIKELDGKVAAFGMGGIDLYLWSGKKRYTMRDAKKIAHAAKVTPIVDGSGLKNTLERRTITYLAEKNPDLFSNKNVLLTCAVDRFGMAEALQTTGCNLTYGDFMFVLGLQFPITSLRLMRFAVGVVAPIAVQLPFKMLYPTGEKQEYTPDKEKFARFYDWANVIAGDYHMIRKYMPDDLKGKTIITNTVTEDDVEFLRDRGINQLITTTPNIQGRSFGTNVIEGLLVALMDKPLQDIIAEDYLNMLDKLEITPRIEQLQAQ